VTNFADDTVSQYDVDPADGELSAKGTPTVGAGNFPIGIAVGPDGESAYVANQASNHISQYDVAADGMLTAKTPATVAGDDPTQIAVRPDTTGPTTTITSGPSGTVGSPNASFIFSSNESGSTFQCRLDSGAFSSCSSPKAYAGLADGAHSFAVRATDFSGNTGPPAMRGWTVDTPEPSTDLILDAQAKQKAKKLKVDVACGEVDCSVNLVGKGTIPKTAGTAVAAAKAKKFKLKPKGVEVAAGATERVRLKFKRNRKSVKKINGLLKQGGRKTRKRAKAVVKATATGQGGSDTAKQKVKLER